MGSTLDPRRAGIGVHQGAHLPDLDYKWPVPPPRTLGPGPDQVRHSWLEDVLAILTAALFISLGLGLLAHAGLLTGGVAGMSLLLARITPFTFGQWLVALNAPFFLLANRQMGWPFTMKTFAAIGAVSLATDGLRRFVAFERVEPAYAAVAGGALVGIGLLILFRHQASLGGLNVAALWLQERRGIRAGLFQLAVDASVLLASLFVVPLPAVLLSVLGAVALNGVLAMNHRPDRYLGT